MEPVLQMHTHVRCNAIKRDSEWSRHTDNSAGPASTPQRHQTTIVMMKNSVIMATCLLLLSSLALQTYANSFGPDECCFKFFPKRLQKSAVVNFRYTDSLCPMEGVLFLMKGGREVCVDATQQWVKKIIKTKEINQAKGATNSTTTLSQ